MVRKRTAPPRQSQSAGAKILSAWLENADVFRTAKTAGKQVDQPAVLVLHKRPDFVKKDFDRKAKDLVRLGSEGRLSKAEPVRRTIHHRDPDPAKAGSRSTARVYRERIIRRLTKSGRLDAKTGDQSTNKYLANMELVKKLYAGKRPVTGPGQGYDPDHIQDLQLDGKDEYLNLRLMDAWTNRELGREISQALRDVPPGTRVEVKVVP